MRCDTHNLANVYTNVRAMRTNITQQVQTFLYTPHGDGCHGRPSAYAVRPGKHRRLKRMHFWTKSKSRFSLGVGKDPLPQHHSGHFTFSAPSLAYEAFSLGIHGGVVSPLVTFRVRMIYRTGAGHKYGPDRYARFHWHQLSHRGPIFCMRIAGTFHWICPNGVDNFLVG